jgi:hypothetical protein
VEVGVYEYNPKRDSLGAETKISAAEKRLVAVVVVVVVLVIVVVV